MRPSQLHCLRNAVLRCVETESSKPNHDMIIGMVYSILLELDQMKRMISVLLYNGHASKRVCKKIVEHMEKWLIHCSVTDILFVPVSNHAAVYYVISFHQSLHRAGQLQELPYQCEQSSKV